MSTARSTKTSVRKATAPSKPVAPAVVEVDQASPAPLPPHPAAPPAGGKLALLISLLQREGGATVAQMTEALGWQAHSVRGAMAGALKARGRVVASEKTDAGRIYRLPAATLAEVRS